MATLTNETVASTYPLLLKVETAGVHATTMRTVEDGDATSSALQISVAAVSSTGTLTSTGDFDVNTDKFTVAAATGNSVIAGTLGVTGVITATGGVTGAVTGNADTATTLETARDITLTGDVTGTASFNGSATASITTTIAANSVDGTMIQMGSDAEGDILTYDGTDYARLGAGDDGQFLQAKGADTQPEWADLDPSPVTTSAFYTSGANVFDSDALGVTKIRVTMVGGGGMFPGASTPAGGGGAYLVKTLTVSGSITFNVAAAGGASTFTYDGTTYTAGNGSSSDGSGGTATNGDINIGGSAGSGTGTSGYAFGSVPGGYGTGRSYGGAYQTQMPGYILVEY